MKIGTCKVTDPVFEKWGIGGDEREGWKVKFSHFLIKI